MQLQVATSLTADAITTQELVQTDLDQHKVFVNGYDNQGNPFCVVLGRRHIPHSHELTRR